ncbi:MAG: hypothetical protein LBJ20_00895 [Candidatus Methanoplasma sp.]|jgi:hypothetical protein|nr:hypothetical protein [Candidatus Methanoplasma sp.]
MKRVSWLAVISAVLTGFLLLDTLFWIVSGAGIGEHISGGVDSPIVISIAERIGVIPDWAFWLAIGSSVLILSVILSLCITASMRPSGWSK